MKGKTEKLSKNHKVLRFSGYKQEKYEEMFKRHRIQKVFWTFSCENCSFETKSKILLRQILFDAQKNGAAFSRQPRVYQILIFMESASILKRNFSRSLYMMNTVAVLSHGCTPSGFGERERSLSKNISTA